MKAKKLATALVAPALLLSACGGPEQGNEFTVTGTVIDVDPDQLTINSIKIIDAKGKSIDRLADGVEKIDDNYKDYSCYEHETSDDLDNLLKSGAIAVGSTVEVSGSVGRSTYNCMPGKPFLSTDRSTITTLHVLEDQPA